MTDLNLPPLASRFIDVESLPWEKRAIPGSSRRRFSWRRRLAFSPRSCAWRRVRLPDHEHVKIEQTYVLEGTLMCPEGECKAGQFVWRPAGAGTTHGPGRKAAFSSPSSRRRTSSSSPTAR